MQALEHALKVLLIYILRTVAVRSHSPLIDGTLCCPRNHLGGCDRSCIFLSVNRQQSIFSLLYFILQMTVLR